MAAIHILAGDTAGFYTAVVHAAAPVGLNEAGVTWADAIQASGRATTVMRVGDGAGQITPAEASDIASGAVIEVTFSWGVDPAWTPEQRQTDLEFRAAQSVAEQIDRYQRELRFFGATTA